MLIYNFQKEFLGIDEDDLQALGFSDLNELQTESYDFADLFVRQPGHIYNFQHVHWIDFLLYADSAEETKAIISAKEKHYRCNLSVRPMYLTDNPTEPAYVIYLNNLMLVSADGIEAYPVQRAVTSETKPKPKKQQTIESKVDFIKEKSAIKETPLISDNDNPIDLESDLKLDIPDINVHEVQKEKPKDEFADYVYDPNVACKELGLPLDLIEEFVQDFISQAFEFKEKLYTALQDGDMDNLKSLSHKLKGVAANLHIENAFQTLTIINTSNDHALLEVKLDSFYRIINKLANKEMEEKIEIFEPISDTKETKPINDFEVDFKNELEEVKPIDNFELDFKDDIEKSETADNFELDFKYEADENQDNESKLEESDDFKLDFKDETKESNLVDDFEPEFEDVVKEANHKNDFELDFKDEIQKSEPNDNVVKESNIQPILSLYNKKEVSQEIGLDMDMFNSLFEHFAKESERLSINIKKAIKENNPKQWQEYARELKRMRDNMRITDFTAELETIINSSNGQEVEEAINKINTIISYISSKGV